MKTFIQLFTEAMNECKVKHRQGQGKDKLLLCLALSRACELNPDIDENDHILAVAEHWDRLTKGEME